MIAADLKKYAFYLLVLVLLAAAIFYDQRQSLEDDQQKQSAKAFPYPVSTLVQVELSSKNNNVELLQKQGRWFVNYNAVLYSADIASVRSLLDRLASKKIVKLTSENVKVNADQIIGSIKARGNTYSEGWQVSSQKTFNGNSYIKRISTQEIFHSKSSWQDLFLKTSMLYISKALILPVKGLSSIQIRTSDLDYQLIKESSSWVIKGSQKKIDALKVNSFLRRFENISAESLLFQLKPPTKNADVEMKFSGSNSYAFKAYRQVDKALLISDNRKVALVMSWNSFEALLWGPEQFKQDEENESIN